MEKTINTIIKSVPTLEGAGVKLHRIFGFNNVPLFDPFLLLDHFGSDDPSDYIKGFPWHPHRGIETVTYMLTGEIEHGDSIGNKGLINSGDIQWMTAASGIIHKEMPRKYSGKLQGFQLWVNLPKKYKMMKPRYRSILSTDIPIVEHKDALVKVISGEIERLKDPVKDLIVDVNYFDITLQKGKKYCIMAKKDYKTCIFVYGGSGDFNGHMVESNHCVLFGEGEEIHVKSNNALCFLFISGKSINEPVAWGGPIVMNSEEELKQAFQELDNRTFIKQHTSVMHSQEYYQK